ncbi:MAG: YbhB/YbcL family Raf kinase inhibitor-like protein [Anaerolineae bacterium]|nr:MAG: YbhB/YbcL family Raf kinase inhibitor-like protein [Anaerolineae bacterium]
MRVWSEAFPDGGTIPVQYTCDGDDISPPLQWNDVPEGTRSFVLIADDPDAPSGRWVHWVVYDIPADLRAIPEAAPATLGVTGYNDFRRTAYGGPCPPRGPAHRYFFTLYALDVDSLGLPAGAGLKQVEALMQGHILAQGQWMGRYGR